MTDEQSVQKVDTPVANEAPSPAAAESAEPATERRQQQQDVPTPTTEPKRARRSMDEPAADQHPAKAAAASVSKPQSVTSHRSSALQLVREMEAQYRASRRDWQRPSSAFRNTQPRFSKTTPPTDVIYAPQNGDLATSVSQPGKPSPWARDRQLQRTQPPAALCQGDYNPQEPQSTRTTARSAFASNTPKSTDPPKVYAGQDSVGPERTDTFSPGSRGRPTSSMRSRSPRFQEPASSPCKGDYDQSYGTINATVASSTTKGSSWSKSKAPQRVEPKPPLVDHIYDVPDPRSKSPNTAKSCFASTDPRIPDDEKPRAPPVGYYTSPFISAGMATD